MTKVTEKLLEAFDNISLNKSHNLTEDITTYLDNTDYDDLKTDYERYLWQINMLWRERKEKLSMIKDTASDKEIEALDKKYQTKIKKLEAKAKAIPEDKRGDAYKQDIEEFERSLHMMFKEEDKISSHWVNQSKLDDLYKRALDSDNLDYIKEQLDEIYNIMKSEILGESSTETSKSKSLNEEDEDFSELEDQIADELLDAMATRGLDSTNYDEVEKFCEDSFISRSIINYEDATGAELLWWTEEDPVTTFKIHVDHI